MTVADLNDSDTNTNQNSTIAIGVSWIEQWFQLLFFYGFLSGILATIFNSAMAVGIARNKNLRTRFFIILFYLLLSRVSVTTQHLLMAIHRTLRILNLVPLQIHWAYCYMLNFQSYYCLTLEMVLIFGLVMEKTLAIVTLNFYRHLTNMQAVMACNIATVATVLLKLIPSVLGVHNFTAVIECLTAKSTITETYNMFNFHIDLILALSILGLYLCLIWYIRFRLVPTMAKIGDEAAIMAYKRQAQLLPLLRLLVLLHCGLALISKILLAVSSLAPNQIRARLVLYGGIVLTLDQFSNAVMLLVTNEELRIAAFPYIFKESNKTTVQQIKLKTTGKKK